MSLFCVWCCLRLFDIVWCCLLYDVVCLFCRLLICLFHAVVVLSLLMYVALNWSLRFVCSLMLLFVGVVACRWRCLLMLLFVDYVLVVCLALRANVVRSCCCSFALLFVA